MSYKPLYALLLAAGLAACCTRTPADFRLRAADQPLMTPSVQKQVDSLYNLMTTDERIAQLHGMFVADLFRSDGQLDTVKCQQQLANGIGHFCQFASSTTFDPNTQRDRVAALQHWIMTHTAHPIPALFHEEVITGMTTLGATVYPQQIGVGCSFDTKLAEQKTSFTADNMRAIGGLLSLSPMVDVMRNPTFNRLEESYGEDAYLTSSLGVAFVRGLQRGDLRKGVAACSKHFLGYGGGGDRPEKEVMEEILMPHEAMIRVSGSKVLMPGYHLFRGEKCVGNSGLINGILRDYVGFDGLVVSDYTAISQIYEGQKQDPAKNAATAIKAGSDVEFPEPANFSHLKEALQKGLLTEKEVGTAVKRVLALKARLGMLDPDAQLYSKGDIKFDTPEERALARKLAEESIVLLKNDGVLPIRPNARIALVGPNANSFWAMLGDYTFKSMNLFWRNQGSENGDPHIVTLREGMQKLLPTGAQLTYERGCDWTEKSETQVASGGDARARYAAMMASRRIDAGEPIDPAKALENARQSDIIVAAMGENALLCGENRDRGGIRLPGRQEDFVRQLIATGKPVVLVMFGGRTQVIGDLASKCAAILQAWYPGEEGGNAVADILYGNISPSGKLCVSYPKVETDKPLCYDYSFRQDPRVQWPFGYGLSYTTFDYSNLSIDSNVATDGDMIHLSFDVKNTGRKAADEVVQIYVSPADRQPLAPIRLQGFDRVSLKPGEVRHVSLIMSPQQLGYYRQRQWHIAPGRYNIMVGASSQDIRLTKTLRLTGKEAVMPLRTVYFAETAE
jgi:beta-glucosidase